MEPGWERDVKVHKGWDLCLCGGGGSVDCSDGGDGGGSVDGGGGDSGVGDGCESDCLGVVDILVLGADFLVEVVERVELVVGCIVRRVVRLVL